MAKKTKPKRADVNHFEYISPHLKLSVERPPYGTHTLHSFTEQSRSGEAIELVGAYFHKPGTLAYRLSQSYPTPEAKIILEWRFFEPNEGTRNLAKLANSGGDFEKLKKAFGVPSNNPLNIDFDVNLSHGPHPINLVQYKLRAGRGTFDQYVLFYSPSGDDTNPLHLKQIEEILNLAKSRGFFIMQEELEKAKESLRKNYSIEDGEELLKSNMAYFSGNIKDELAEYVFSEG